MDDIKFGFSVLFSMTIIYVVVNVVIEKLPNNEKDKHPNK
jgi:hypothetical protein